MRSPTEKKFKGVTLLSPNVNSPDIAKFVAENVRDSPHLRDFEAIKIGKQLGKLQFSGSDNCEESVSTQRQWDLITAVEACFEGVRHDADTDTYMRFDRGEHRIKTSLRTQGPHEFPWRRTFSHAQGQWHSSSDKVCRSRVQTVGGRKFFFFRYSVEGRSHSKRQEICVEICLRDETSLNSTTRGRASSAAAFVLGLSTCEMGPVTVRTRSCHSPCVTTVKTMVSGHRFIAKRTWGVKGYNHLAVSVLFKALYDVVSVNCPYLGDEV